MHVTIDNFWQLALASGALSHEQCERLRAEFAGIKGAARAGAGSLAQWLVSTGALTPYQAKVLAAGHPGPFAFGPFVVRDRIEKGRLARLYRASYEGSQNVLLVFLSQLTDDTRDYDVLVELAGLAAKIKNPHVTRTFRAAQHANRVFIVVEDLAGRTLAEILPYQRLKTRKACQVGLQLALALVSLGNERLVHGAVCPHNVWIDSSSTARLMQFPLVAAFDRQQRLELPLVDYVAPELTEPNAQPTLESDVYSLGCTLYEMIAARVPFPGGTAQQKIARHRGEIPQRLDALDPEVPEELADLVEEMLAKDPLLRCASASQAAHLLAPFVTKAKGIASRPPTTGQPRPGFGAWQAPEWKAPPPQAAPIKPLPDAPPIAAAVQPAAPVVERPAPAAKAPAPAARPASAAKQPRPPAASVAAQPAAPAREPLIDSTGVDAEPDASPRPDAPHDELPTTFDFGADDGAPDDAVADADVAFASFVTDTEPVVPAARTRNQMSKVTLARIVAAVASLITLTITGAYLVYRDRAIHAPDPPKAAAPTPTIDPKDDPEWQANVERIKAGLRGEADPPADNLTADDGQTLWVSPTSGKPLDTAFLPNGTQVILALRPAELLAGPEGARLLAALGPAGAWSAAHLRQTLGIDLKLIEQLTIAVAPDDALAPRTTYVMRFAQEVPEQTLFDAWGRPGTALHASKRYYQGKSLTYYRPESGMGRVVVVAPKALMQQMLEFEGQPLVRASLEALLARSDASRQLNLLLTPSYLLTDGRELLAGHLQELHAPLRSFLADDVDAALLSAHVGDALYVELRAVAPAHLKPLELKDRLRARWAQVPAQVEALIAGLSPQPYGKLILLRLPRMLQTAVEFTRSGVDDDQAVLNAYLPASAAHNLVLGTELALLEASSPPTGAAPTAASSPRTAAAALAAPISLSFPRESLDRAMAALSQEIGVTISIQGADLQLEGITKNQSLVNVDERDQPAADILRKLLKLANPDGKLVYVIKPDEHGAEAIWITTRAAATKRGDTLPAGF